MDSKEVEGMVADMESYLRGKEMSEGGWKGHASPSALAVGAAVVALHLAGKETYASQIGQGAIWLEGCRRDDGSWGDSPTSCSSWVSTLFAYAALQLLDRPSLSSRDYLLKALGGNFEQKLAGAIRTHYRAEPSFAEAVLLFCFVCGLLPERDCRPRRFSKPHGLTAGYLAPAWASEDLFCAERCRSFFFSSPKSFTPSLLERLQKLQATDGGFSASVPMTALAVLSLCLTGYGSHEMVDKACAYLCATQRKKGSWPIGADLSLKLTCLGLRALGKEIANRHALTLRFRHRLAEAGAAE
ncbi:MAG: hypothetical protein LBL81_06370, partial [Tannerella sp.]|nr:hypothetical protein [Tannerella sp.]